MTSEPTAGSFVIPDTPHGFDRKGECGCEWSSSSHGNMCPQCEAPALRVEPTEPKTYPFEDFIKPVEFQPVRRTPPQPAPTYTMQQAKPVSNVYRSDYIGINPTRPYLHDFGIGDIVRCLDSEPDLIDALSGQMFVRLARSGAYVNHESLTLVSTEYRLYTMQQAIGRIVDGLVLEWVRLPIGDRYYADAVAGGYFAHHDGWWIEGEHGPARPCDSLDHAKQLCLEDYKSRFQAEIEKAVANHG